MPGGQKAQLQRYLGGTGPIGTGALGVRGDPAGITAGEIGWPSAFDPRWLRTCSASPPPRAAVGGNINNALPVSNEATPSNQGAVGPQHRHTPQNFETFSLSSPPQQCIVLRNEKLESRPLKPLVAVLRLQLSHHGTIQHRWC